MWSAHIARHNQLFDRQPHGRASLRHGEHITHHRNRRRMAAGSVPAEYNVSAELAAGDDHVLRAVRPRDRRGLRHQHRANASPDYIAIELRTRNLANRAAQLLRVREVDCADVLDRLRRNILRMNLRLQCEARQDAQLRARIETIDIGGRIGLGVAARCALASTSP